MYWATMIERDAEMEQVLGDPDKIEAALCAAVRTKRPHLGHGCSSLRLSDAAAWLAIGASLFHRCRLCV